jgi:hypothetical protein
VPHDVTDSDRRIAALAHFGVPIYSVLLPLTIWGTSASHPFRRDNAREAFSFQCVFLGLWIVLVGLMITGRLSAITLLILLGLAFLLELPQAARAISGRQPWRMVPVRLLPT